jgi:hypothetical protein
VGQGTGKKMGIKLWNKWFGEGTFEKENILTALLPSAACFKNTESLNFRRKLSRVILSIYVITGNFLGRRRAICHEKWTY